MAAVTDELLSRVQLVSEQAVEGSWEAAAPDSGAQQAQWSEMSQPASLLQVPRCLVSPTALPLLHSHLLLLTLRRLVGRGRNRKKYDGKVTWEAYLTRFVMADEREKLGGRRVVGGDVTREVTRRLSSTLELSCCSLHLLVPLFLSAPRSCFVASSK